MLNKKYLLNCGLVAESKGERTTFRSIAESPGKNILFKIKHRSPEVQTSGFLALDLPRLFLDVQRHQAIGGFAGRYLVLLYLYSAAGPGWTSNEFQPTASPDR